MSSEVLPCEVCGRRESETSWQCARCDCFCCDECWDSDREMCVECAAEAKEKA